MSYPLSIDLPYPEGLSERPIEFRMLWEHPFAAPLTHSLAIEICFPTQTFPMLLPTSVHEEATLAIFLLIF